MPPIGKSVGIVGSEAAKFTPETEAAARSHIRGLVLAASRVVSGGCHLGGVDAWAAEIGRELGVEVVEHLPKRRCWSGGYRERNVLIAEDSAVVHCVTVSELPPGFLGMRFAKCYHCGTAGHVKSGGCWTVRYARGIRKVGCVWVVLPDGIVEKYS